MTDELDRLRKELRAAEPRPVARAKGMNAAMKAFDEEFAKEDTLSRATTRDLAPPDKSIQPDRDPGSLSGAEGDLEKSSTSTQGSDSHRRLTGQNAPRGGAKPRRRSMTSRIPTINMMFGGTAVAAALAALVVLPNIKGEFDSAYDEIGDVVIAESEVTASVRQAPADFADAATDAEADETAAPSVVAIAPAPSEVPPPGPVSRAGADEILGRLRAPQAEPTGGAETRGLSVTYEAAKRTAPRDDAFGGAQPKSLMEEGTPLAENRDKFESVENNPVKLSAEDPVSTFSIDADTASYSFMRASLNRGQMPNPDSVRVEELINYFPYDYAAPTDAQQPFKSSVTVMPTPWNADTKLLHIGIKGYQPTVIERPNANIVLLIDTSGSMSAQNKLPLLINSFKLLLDTLGEDDTVSIVTYAGSAGTVLEPTAATERGKILAAFDRLRAGGSTAGAAGLELAYQKAQESFDADGVNRVILATDGDFNVGFSSPDEMKTFVEKKRESGVFLSVLGFGSGNYNDHLMQALAQNGNGVAAYIDTLSEARKVLADEAGGALIPIAKDVKIQVEFNPQQISEYRLIGYETRALNREDFNNDKVDAGEIGSGHAVTAIYEITPKGSPAELVDDFRYSNQNEAQPSSVTAKRDEYAFVKIRYKLPNEDVSSLMTHPVTELDEAHRLDTASTEAQFAISVAAMGQLLRRSSAIGDFNYDDIISLAERAKGDDEFGYRAEFINLVRLARSLDHTP